MNNIIRAGVSIITDELSDLELATLNVVAQTNESLHGQIFDYDKVKMLFTIDGERMHKETKDALASIVVQRLSK